MFLALSHLSFFSPFCIVVFGTEPLQSLKASVEFLNLTLITAYKINKITGKYTHLGVQGS